MGTDEAKGKAKAKKKLPQHLADQRDYVTCLPDYNSHPGTYTSATVFQSMGVDNSWDFDAFASDFKIQINRLEEDVMEFDMIGCDPAIANALRRILIAEVPTIAIEHVFVVNNTSIVQDEVLAHRLGLVPLAIDPALLEPKAAEEAPSEKNTIVFELDVKCTRAPDGRIVNEKVLSKELRWLPQGSRMPDETTCRFASGQAHMFGGASGRRAPAPVHSDILLAKLRPGQCIQLEAHCVKGTGREHAKWSPVATAWYRLHPEVVLLREVSGALAQELAATAPGIFEVVAGGRLQANSARGHEKHLEKLRRLLEREDCASAYAVRKRKDHFIFTIESTGVLPPEQLFVQALAALQDKAARLADKL